MGGSGLGGMKGFVYVVNDCYLGCYHVENCGGCVLTDIVQAQSVSIRELYAACNQMCVSCLRVLSVTVACYKHVQAPCVMQACPGPCALQACPGDRAQ